MAASYFSKDWKTNPLFFPSIGKCHASGFQCLEKFTRHDAAGARGWVRSRVREQAAPPQPTLAASAKRQRRSKSWIQNHRAARMQPDDFVKHDFEAAAETLPFEDFRLPLCGSASHRNRRDGARPSKVWPTWRAARRAAVMKMTLPQQ